MGGSTGRSLLEPVRPPPPSLPWPGGHGKARCLRVSAVCVCVCRMCVYVACVYVCVRVCVCVRCVCMCMMCVYVVCARACMCACVCHSQPLHEKLRCLYSRQSPDAHILPTRLPFLTIPRTHSYHAACTLWEGITRHSATPTRPAWCR